MPSGGRFGYKCIPAHTTCEVYHNTSGAEASITFATQVLDAENSVDVNVAITDGQCTLTCCSALYTSGTSGAKNLIGVHNRGEYQGAFFRGRGDNELNYTRVGRYTNPSGTNCCAPAGADAAPYGGTEVILPGSTDLLTITECFTQKVPYCYNVTWSCDGCCPYFVHSFHTECNDDNASRRFVNVYDDNAGPYDFSRSSSLDNAIESSTYHIFCVSRDCITAVQGTGCAICHWVVNHYGTHVTGDTTLLNSPAACTVTKTCSCAERSQAVIMGLDQGCSATYNWVTSSCSLVTCTNVPLSCCAPLQTHPDAIVISSCGAGTFWNNICCLTGDSISKARWCCNTRVGNPLMSPYGVQRAATYGVVTWAFCNSEKGTGYYFGYPRGDKPWGITAACGNFSFGVGVWVNVPHTHCCEYPMKYLAHDPNTCRTYTMMRSCMNSNCGIYEINYDELYSMTLENCGCHFGFTQNIRPLPAMQWTSVEYEEGSNQFFNKVADFPKEMTEAKYENANGQMCVSCIYKYGPTHWSLQVYNHTDNAWDTFTTTNLYTWNRDNNLSLNLSDDVKVYKIDDSCVVNYTDQFDENVPKSTIIDYGVRSNAYERSGIVVSNGDAIVIKNDGDYPISAQVWGFEG